MKFGLSWFSSTLCPAHLPDSQHADQELNWTSRVVEIQTKCLFTYLSLNSSIMVPLMWASCLSSQIDWLVTLLSSSNSQFHIFNPPLTPRSIKSPILTINLFSINIRYNHASCPMQNFWSTLTSGFLEPWNRKRVKNTKGDHGYKEILFCWAIFIIGSFILNCHYIFQTAGILSRDQQRHITLFSETFRVINHDKTELVAETQISHSSQPLMIFDTHAGLYKCQTMLKNSNMIITINSF